MKVLEATAWIFALYFITMIVLLSRLHMQYNNETEEEIKYKLLTNNNTFSLRSSEYASLKIGKGEYEKGKYENDNEKDEEPFRKYGPGENGEKVILTGLNISFPGLAERNKKHNFNTFISDMISLHRKIPDTRASECKTRVYPNDLPPISIVIIFRDEWWSILLRTIYSVIEASPPELIHEVIVVDDGSTDVDLVTRVKIHIQNLNKVRLIQNKVPRGLMMARQAGIDAVKSDMFIVMDGHMEVGPGWLEPLIHRLVQQPKALLCSQMGGINQENFEFRIDRNRPENKLFPFFELLSLDQTFAKYKREFKEQRNNSVEPIPFGTIQGMMMVMRKDFFKQLGGFDPSMKVWGSEQIELSVKVWMCGGVVEMVPCSIVAHMFRMTPWGSIKNDNDYHSLNKARLAQVWIDPPFNENINYFLSDKNYTIGDLSARQRIRKINHCKPYQYFVDKVKSFSDVYIPTNIQYRGKIQNDLFHFCVDAVQENSEYRVILYPCHERLSANQYFILTDTSQVRGVGNTLLHVKRTTDEHMLDLLWTPSVDTSPGTVWKYEGQRLVHKDTTLCLTALTRDTLGLKPCIGSRSQNWKWS